MGEAVIIAGGFGNLGMAIARAFKQKGARVALAGIGLTAERRDECKAFDMTLDNIDLTDLGSTADAFERIQHEFGYVDTLINTAGGFTYENFNLGSVETWDRMYALNVRTVITATKAALPLLIRNGHGRVICIGSAAADKGVAGTGAYVAAKSAVVRFTESLADELKDDYITVNAVLPQVIDTPENRRSMPDADFTRWVATDHISSLVLYLASESASAITGASLAIRNRC